jgi:acetyl-CoA acetyltransferase
MSEKIYVIGAGQSHYGKFFDRNIKSLVGDAVSRALEQAGVEATDLEAAWVGNATQGTLTGQEMIRGQVALRPAGIDGIPIVNVENACASASTAFNGAWMGIKAGLYDCVIAVGMEKMAFEDPDQRRKAMESFSAAVDIEGLERMRSSQKAAEQELAAAGKQSAYGENRPKSMFMDIYGASARRHMERYGTTQLQLAIVSSKNHRHASLNPYAQYRKEMSPEEVLADDIVSYPLTRPMCAPLGDGAAAAVLCSESFLKRLSGARPVEVLASKLASGSERRFDGMSSSQLLVKKAYETAGLGPEDIDVAEVHDATAFAEITEIEALGFCKPGEGGPFSASGATSLGGKIPVNTSGGLESRGHPIGATGLAQITEIIWQLRGECGLRQVEDARIGMTQNAGGSMPGGSAALAIHIFARAF